VCLDEAGAVWFMLHSGSRGVGNAIGTHFIELAKKDAELHQRNLPDQDLAYLKEGAQYFGDYVRGVGWAQKFARLNREVMMQAVVAARAQGDHQAVRGACGGGELPPQLRAAAKRTSGKTCSSPARAR
jgi:RNA-splicing ligase RtcB